MRKFPANLGPPVPASKMPARIWIRPKRFFNSLFTSFYFRLCLGLIVTFFVIQVLGMSTSQSALGRRPSSTVAALTQMGEELRRMQAVQTIQWGEHERWRVKQEEVRKVMEEQNRKLKNFVAEQKDQLADFRDLLEHKRRLRLPLRRNYIAPHDPSEFKRDTFVPFGSHGFIRFSAYRTTPQQIVALGLAALALEKKRKLGGCYWHSGGVEDIISGTLTFHSTLEHHYLQIVDPPQPWKFKLTYCSSPLYGSLDVRRVWEWFEYHRVVVGMDAAVFYNVGAVTNELRAALKDYYEAGWIEEVEFQGAQSYETWLYCQLLTVSDCVYRTRLTSKWIFMADTDEYIVPRPPQTVASILRKHQNAAYLTHAQTVGGAVRCVEVESEDPFIIEKLVFRWPGVYCSTENKKMFPDPNFCLDHFGHRKYFLNPRKVHGLAIHRVFDSEPGVDLSTTADLTHFHFSGLTTPLGTTMKEGLCKEPVPFGFVDNWWVMDTVLAEAVPWIRSCAFKNRTCATKIE